MITADGNRTPVKAAVRDVLVIGGGIAGLALAIALRRRGIGVDVVEVDDRTDGASIGLTNRAVDVLDELGLLSACAAAGHALRGSVFDRMYNERGEELPLPPVPPRADDRLPGAVVIHRGELARILRTHVLEQGARMRTKVTARSLAQGPDGVDVVFTDSTVGRYDLVVGADGAHSWTRQQILGNRVRPTYTGHMSLRCLVPGIVGGHPGFYNSPTGTVILGHLPPDTVYVATGVDMAYQYVSPSQARRLLRKTLDQYSAPYVRSVRDRITDDVSVIARPYEWLLVPPPWHQGRVVLIGDAAHATTAHLSSGGAMALEDAAVLARELAAEGDLPHALTRFIQCRADRVRTVVEASVKLAGMQQAHASPQEMGRVRAQAMAALLSSY